MQNKKILILIIGIILIGGATTSYLLLNKQKKETGQSITATLKEFLPFGTSSKVENGEVVNENGEVVNENEETLVEENKLNKITSFGIAGFIFFEDLRPKNLNISETSDTSNIDFDVVPSLRYVEKATGHIYQKYLDNGVETKISNSTIPSIYEAVFGGDLKSLIFRYISSDIKTISSYLGTLGAEEGEFLPENVSSVALSPDKNKFFYLTPFSGGINEQLRSFSNTKKSQIFTSSFTEWIPQWPSSQTIYLTTKASYSVPGYVYSLNVSNGSFNKVFGGINGFTTLVSPDNSMILYSSTTNSGPKLIIYNTRENSNTQTGLFGLPEKCIWNKTSTAIYCGIPSFVGKTEPDSWYQGLTSFDDNFVKIDAYFGNYSNLDTFSSESLDAINLYLDNNEKTLFFINKKTPPFGASIFLKDKTNY